MRTHCNLIICLLTLSEIKLNNTFLFRTMFHSLRVTNNVQVNTLHLGSPNSNREIVFIYFEIPHHRSDRMEVIEHPVNMQIYKKQNETRRGTQIKMENTININKCKILLHNVHDECTDDYKGHPVTHQWHYPTAKEMVILCNSVCVRLRKQLCSCWQNCLSPSSSGYFCAWVIISHFN